MRRSAIYPQRCPLFQWSDRRRLRLGEGKRSRGRDISNSIARDRIVPPARGSLAVLLLRAQHPVEGGDNLGKSACDTFVAPLTLGGAMNSIDWRSTILRWGAVAFSFGAWVGVVVLVRQLLG